MMQLNSAAQSHPTSLRGLRPAAYLPLHVRMLRRMVLLGMPYKPCFTYTIWKAVAPTLLMAALSQDITDYFMHQSLWPNLPAGRGVRSEKPPKGVDNGCTLNLWICEHWQPGHNSHGCKPPQHTIGFCGSI